jgi:hypothetical protein
VVVFSVPKITHMVHKNSDSSIKNRGENQNVKWEGPKVLTVNVTIFCVVTPCSMLNLVSTCQRDVDTYLLQPITISSAYS